MSNTAVPISAGRITKQVLINPGSHVQKRASAAPAGLRGWIPSRSGTPRIQLDLESL